MVYRAYANRQEIASFPVNGVETDEIWGGDMLLWKKRQVKEPFTVKTYLPSSSYHVTNGNRFSIRTTLPSSVEKWTMFNNKEPYTTIKSDVGDNYNIRIHAMAEIGGAICYLKSKKISTTFMQITINSVVNKSEVTSTYVHTSENGCGLVDVAWIMNNYVYCHFAAGSSDNGTFCHIVLKFNTSGKLIEKYEKAIPDRNEAYNYKFPIIEASYTTIKSKAFYYAVKLQNPVLSMYKLNENPFEIYSISLLNLGLYYIGSCDSRHIFGNFSKNNATTIYEFIDGEFVKKRVLPYNLSYNNCCVCKNHIYGADAAIYDFGSIDTDSERNLIYSIPDSVHYVQSQESSIYVFHGGSSEKNTQYMTIIPL